MSYRCVLLVLLVVVGLRAGEIQELDRPVCYINDTVITRGDVGERLQQRLYILRSRGQMPTSTEQIMALEKRVMQELIDEELLYQHAQELQVQVDMRDIRREVVRQANARGFGSDMLSIAKLVEQRERQVKIEQVIRFYEEAEPSPGPEALRAAYEAQRERFRRPSQVSLRQIMLPTTELGQLEGLRRELLAMVRLIKGHAKPAISDLVADDFIDQVVEAEGRDQFVLLGNLLDRLLASELAPVDAPLLVERARRLREEMGVLRSREEALNQIDLLRSLCLRLSDPAARDALFGFYARIFSGGREARRFGDLGQSEPGALGESVREAIDGLDTGDLSQPFWQGQAATLVLVSERSDAAVPALAEVTAEIEAVLERQRHVIVRDRCLAQLRGKAEITMVDPGHPDADLQ